MARPNKEDTVQASFGDDTLSQREAAVRLFDEQEGFTEQNTALRPTRTPKQQEQKKNTAPFSFKEFSKAESVATGRTTKQPEGNLVEVRMNDGFVMTGVPDNATKAEIFESYNKANNFVPIGGTEPGFVRRTKDGIEKFMTGGGIASFLLTDDIQKSMVRHAEEFPVIALGRALFENETSLQPKFDSNDVFQGFEKFDKKQTAELRKKQHELYVQAINAPEEGTREDITGEVLGHVLDPINLMALRVGGPSASWLRFGKIFGAEAVIGGSREAARQSNLGANISEIDKKKVAQEAAIQGMAVAGFDKAVGFWMVAKQAAKGSPKAMNKSLDILEDEVTKNVQKGYNRKHAVRRAMKTTGETFRSVKKATSELDRKVDLSGENLKRLPNKIKHTLGIDKIHVPRGIEKLGTPLSSVIRDISPRMFSRLRWHDFGVAQMEGRAYAQMSDFFARGQKGLADRALNASGVKATGIHGKVKLLDGRTVDAEEHLMGLVLNGDARQVKKLGQDINDPLLYPAYVRARKEFDYIQGELVRVGLLEKGVKDFWPRMVKDIDGLKKAMRGDQRTAVEKALNKAEVEKGSHLTGTESSAIINKFILGRRREISPGRKITSGRTIDVIPSKLLPFYENLNTSAVRYIDDTSKMIQKKLFFDGSAKSAKGGRTDQETISKIIDAELRAGNMVSSDIQTMQGLLESRFVAGGKGPGKFIQNLRNLFYTSTLGQLSNAATQIADLGFSAISNGIANTIDSLRPIYKRVFPENFNMTRKIAEDFGGTEGTAKLLSNTLHGTGFKFIDRMGKTANMNAAILQGERQVRTAKGVKEFRKQWGDIFGKETEAVIKDLQAKRITENVKFLAFNKLADIQPINLSEMPQKYLDMENGRIFYALSTFTIKQLDFVRRRAIREIVHGDAKKGVNELVKYGMLFGSANLGVAQIKDWIRGRDVEFSDQVVDSMFKTVGTSEYVVSKAHGGQFKDAVVSSLMPITSVLDTAAVLADADNWGKRAHLISNKIPFGQLYYDWFGGGIEEFRERQEKEAEREEFKDEFGDEFDEEDF